MLPPLELFDLTCGGEPRACEDKDADGDPEGSDCDDTDKNRFHGNPRPRNCCQCTDVTSCATNHNKRADESLCQPKRCDTTFDFDCTGLNVDCFTDDDCDGYSPNNPDTKLRDCDDTDSRVHPNAQKLCDPDDGVIKDWACDGRPSGGLCSLRSGWRWLSALRDPGRTDLPDHQLQEVGATTGLR
jgi:hypothetical protein